MDIQSLTLLANMLARKYNIDVRAEGSQAFCEIQENGATTITVPAFTIESDAQRVYVRGYIDHEIGHARFTKFSDDYIEPTLRSIQNILEDVYVERMMSQCYPGCGLNLKAMQHQLFEVDKTFEKVDMEMMGGVNDNTNYNLVYWRIMRYILYRARGVNGLLDMARDELDNLLPKLVQELEPLMQKIPSCSSTADNVVLGREIYNKVLEYLKSDDNQQQSGQGQQGQGQQDQQSQGQQSQGQQGQQSQGDGSGGGASGEQTASDGKQDGNKSGTAKKQSDEELKRNMLGKIHHDKGLAEKIANEINNALRSAINTATNAVDNHRSSEFRMPEKMSLRMLGRTILDTMPANMRAEAEGCATALSAQLHALMQAKGLRKRRLGLFGKLDNSKLHRIVMNNPRVFMRTTEVRQVNTQVLILCDASGSMNDNLKDRLTSEAVYALMKALRNIHGVKSGAYAFGGKIFEEMSSFDTPLYRSKFNLAYCTGNTPGGSALQRLLHEFDLSKDDRKIVLLLTDGDFDGNERPVFNAVYREAQAYGIDVIGVGINSIAVQGLWKKGDFFYIENLKELAPKLFEILKTRLV